MQVNRQVTGNNYKLPYFKNTDNIDIKPSIQKMQQPHNTYKNKQQVAFSGWGQLFTFHDAIMCLLDGVVIYTACRLEAKHSHESKDALDKKHVRGAFFDHGATFSEFNAEKYYGSIHNAISESDKIASSPTKKAFLKILELSTEGIISKDISDNTEKELKPHLQNAGTEGILEACGNIKSYIVCIAKSLAQNDPGFYRESIKTIKRMTNIIEKVEKKMSKVISQQKLTL